MNDELTPEKARELGKQFHNALVSSIPLDELLAGLDPDELLDKYGRARLVAKLKPKERLAGLSIEELEAYLRELKKAKQ